MGTSIGPLHRFEIRTTADSPGVLFVRLDGKPLRGVKRVVFDGMSGEPPEVELTFSAGAVDVDSTAFKRGDLDA